MSHDRGCYCGLDNYEYDSCKELDCTKKNHIFVFGSNLAGRHGKGAALYALRNHGAIYGNGEGYQGKSYGIPTKDMKLKVLPISTIRVNVEKFMKFAKANPRMIFDLTPIGCGLAGYTPNDIAPLFVGSPWNVVMPTEFKEFISVP